MIDFSWDMESWYVFFDGKKGERRTLRENIEEFTERDGYFRAKIMWIKLDGPTSVPGDAPKMRRDNLPEKYIWALRDRMPAE